MAAGDLITRDGQVEWNGLLMGAGTTFRWANLEGWNDAPPTRGQDDPRVGRHGALPGQLLYDERTITYTWKTKGVALSGFGAAIAGLRSATALAENPVEQPLVVRVDGLKLMVNARVVKRAIPTDLQYAVGYTSGAIQWVASNPRRFALPQQSLSTGLPNIAPGGLVFPLVFPLDFGPTTSGGIVTIVNNGDLPAWPQFQLTAGTALQGPIITNLDGAGQLVFDPAWALLASQGPVLIDTDLKSVTYVNSGVSARPHLFVNTWFSVPPQSSIRVRFSSTAADPGASLTALAYHTYS